MIMEFIEFIFVLSFKMRETGLKQVFYLNTEYILFVQSVLEMKFIKGRKNTGRNTIKMGKKIEYNTNDK